MSYLTYLRTQGRGVLHGLVIIHLRVPRMPRHLILICHTCLLMAFICLRRGVEKDIRVFSTTKTGHMDFEKTLLVLRSDTLIVAHSRNGVANVPTWRHIRAIHLNRSEFLSGLTPNGAKIRVGNLS